MSTTVDLKGSAFRDLRRFPDVLRLRSGGSVTVHFVEPEDGKALQTYFQTLSPHARYNRLTGASNGLSDRELDQLLHIGEGNRFAVVVEMMVDGVATIVGEARYIFDERAGSFEFGLSVHDAYRRYGIGTALLSNLECRAAALGAHHIFGDTLRTNTEMQALARKAGFSFTNTPGDWRELRLVKSVADADDMPCFQWRDVAADRALRLGA